MGYETDIFVCERMGSGPKPYLSVIAYLDLAGLSRNSSFVGHCQALQKKASEKKDYEPPFEFCPNAHAQSKEDSEYAKEDCYGDPLVAIPLEKALSLLQKDHEASQEGNWEGDGYRRLQAAVALLEVASKRWKDHDMVVVPWGH